MSENLTTIYCVDCNEKSFTCYMSKYKVNGSCQSVHACACTRWTDEELAERNAYWASMSRIPTMDPIKEIMSIGVMNVRIKKYGNITKHMIK